MNENDPCSHEQILELHAILLQFAIDNKWKERDILAFLTATIVGQLAMSSCSDRKIISTGDMIAQKALMKRFEENI